jgi:hypothetical protein
VTIYTNGQNAAMAGLADVVDFLSVHSAVPNTSGSNELVGGSYARQAVSWNAPASGLIDNTAIITHPIPAGGIAFCYGLWSLVTGGTFYGYTLRTGVGEAVYGFGSVDSAGVTSNTIQSAANGLANAMQVVLNSLLGESLPTGLSANTRYYVVGATTDTFQLSLTEGGAAIDITAQGELFFQRVVPETFSSAGNLTAAAGAIDLSAAVLL